MVPPTMQMKVPGNAPVQAHLAASTALAKAVLPSIDGLEGASEKTVMVTEAWIAKLIPELVTPWRMAQRSLVEAARLFTGKPLTQLDDERAATLVASWATHPVLGPAINAVASMYKITHFDRPDTAGTLRSALSVVQTPEPERWHQQICRAEDWDGSEVLECDVVIIGTGAGGAVVGRHLADQGHAVVFVEEGELVQRHEFPRHFTATVEQVYRSVMSLGNAPMFIPQGRLVGGSTAVNTGTSFRAPSWVLDRWCEQMDSDEFSSQAMAPYFERVESNLQVEPADVRYAGPVYDIFKRGAESLGWHNETVNRNAPGCRGEGFCDNGCPTDARRSTNIAYLPPAMERGAFLLSGMKADRIVIEGGRAAGLEGIALDRLGRPILDERGDRKRIRVKAKKVIVAAGSLASPRLLGRQGIGNPAHRGSHLTLHPSGPAVGMFDQPVRSQDFIPQSIYSHQFLKEGIMLLGAAAEAHMTPPTLPFYGRRLMEIVQRHDYLGPMGFLVTDSTEGRLREGPNGRALLTYNLSKQDTAKVHRAQVLLAELMLEAGAKEVYPGLLRPFTVRNRADLRRLQEAKLGAKDFLVTSYHPLGTCRMSRDAKDGVVDLNHQCHDLPDLFVVDGSTVRGPLGVNPQVTIMALATRAAEKIGPLIED